MDIQGIMCGADFETNDQSLWALHTRSDLQLKLRVACCPDLVCRSRQQRVGTIPGNCGGEFRAA